jgi:alpha-tubulin suppressor-like RCC1 family protein
LGYSIIYISKNLLRSITMKSYSTLSVSAAAALHCVALLSLTVMLNACGGGGGGDAAAPPAGPPAGPPVDPPPPPPAPPSASLTGPTRVVANTRYSYQASVTGGTIITSTLSWGDSTPDSSTPTVTATSAVQKVWGKPGSFTSSLQALVDGLPLSATQSVVVTGAPLAAGLNHTCALSSVSGVLCWGNNTYGQVGNGTTATAVTSPVPILGFFLPNFTALAAGANHTCALQTDGGVRCWGRNRQGQLGDGTQLDRSFSDTVTGLNNVVALAAGLGHTCALQSAGTVRCWGNNQSGQLGDGSFTSNNNSVAVADLSDAVAITAGDSHTCALEANGKVRCWGDNQSGQLGTGNTTNSSTGVTVTGLNKAVVALTAGLMHTCVALLDGSMKCWGQNFRGQLGDGSTVNSTRPVDVFPEVDNDNIQSLAIALVAGTQHTCSLKAGGSMRCWGNDIDKQLGYANPIFTYYPTPAPVSGLSDAVAMAAGGKHTCALQANGNMSCWGSNSNGQLGDGSVVNKTTLVQVSGGAIFWK